MTKSRARQPDMQTCERGRDERLGPPQWSRSNCMLWIFFSQLFLPTRPVPFRPRALDTSLKLTCHTPPGSPDDGSDLVEIFANHLCLALPRQGDSSSSHAVPVRTSGGVSISRGAPSSLIGRQDAVFIRDGDATLQLVRMRPLPFEASKKPRWMTPQGDYLCTASILYIVDITTFLRGVTLT